ncbi:hypothetical protein CRUP_016839 [Coryphaenoides rupestris]|nr:hypothetical protein CRUP_016839 [Coryphaenoides rupestris]
MNADEGEKTRNGTFSPSRRERSQPFTVGWPADADGATADLGRLETQSGGRSRLRTGVVRRSPAPLPWEWICRVRQIDFRADGNTAKREWGGGAITNGGRRPPPPRPPPQPQRKEKNCSSSSSSSYSSSSLGP